MKQLIWGGTAFSILFAPLPAFAQRAETSTQAVVAVSDLCALTPAGEVKKFGDGTQEFFGPVLGAILAAAAGELVKTGVNAAGEALEAVSREQGFVAEGTATFYAGQINFTQAMPKKPDGSDSIALPPRAHFAPGQKCLHLFVPGAGPVDDIFADNSLTRNGAVKFDWLGDGEVATKKLQEARAALLGLGVNSRPDLYAEILINPGKEGFVAKPMLVWYRVPLKGARPKGASAAELHLLLSTPAFDAEKPGIGTGFASARIALPKLEPTKVLTWYDLKGTSSVSLPLRPTTGFIDTSVTAFNQAVAGVGTAKANLRKAESAHAAAKRLVARDPKPESQEGLIVAAESEAEARMELALAEQAISDQQAVKAGATNVQSRIVIIRDENKFGMALAKALKGQAEAAGKAATEALAPKTDWTAEDTTYLTAIQDVEVKQKAYDTALAGGDAAATLTGAHDLRLAKAKANEAAVSSKRKIPYPALLK